MLNVILNVVDTQASRACTNMHTHAHTHDCLIMSGNSAHSHTLG